MVGEDTKTRFAIVFTARVGSTYLADLLRSHPDITCHGELFTPGHALFDEADTTDTDAYFEQVMRDTPTPVVGFKHSWVGMVAQPHTLSLLRDPSLRVIRAQRENLLAMHVSALLIETNGFGDAKNGKYRVDEISVDIDRAFRELQAYYFAEQVLDELVRSHAVAHVTYEHLVENPGPLLGQLQRFLGVEPKTLTSGVVRRRIRPLRETITNWDELAKAFRGTHWEQFLDEGA